MFIKLKNLPSYYPNYSKWVFILLLVGVSFAYNYHKILFLRPQSIHQWRQCDCLSITMNFYKDGMDFFHPAVYCQFSDNGTSGRTVSEFPVIYYFVALLWKIFGYHEFIFRMVNLIIAFTGLYAFLKLTEDLFLDSIWAMGLPLLLFTSPMFAYYANNFLANVPALSFAVISWYFFYQFYKEKKLKWLWISMFCFLLAGLIKITTALSFTALMIVFLIELLNIANFKNGKKLFDQPRKQFLPFLMVIIGLVTWYSYARYYNKIHNANYFLTSVWPIWTVSYEYIQKTLENIRVLWLGAYLNKIILAITGLILIWLLILHKKINKFLLTCTILIFFGSIIHLLLFFYALRDHDYYVIDLLILPFFIIVTFLSYFKKKHPKIFHSIYLKIAFILFLAYDVSHCSKQINDRYTGGWNYDWGKSDTYYKEDFATITPYIRSLGIARTDKVISIPDHSFNISLYLMDQKGWTDFGSENQDSAQIVEKIQLGAQYLFISDSSLYSQNYIQPFIKNKIGTYKNIDIYDLNQIDTL